MRVLATRMLQTLCLMLRIGGKLVEQDGPWHMGNGLRFEDAEAHVDVVLSKVRSR